MKYWNKRYLIWSIQLLAVLIVIVFAIWFSIPHEMEKMQLVKALDDSFTLQIPSYFVATPQSEQNTSFVLDFHAKEECYLYASHIPKTAQIPVLSAIEEDQARHWQERESLQNASTITTSTLGTYPIYEYQFVSYDPSYGKTFFTNTIWIETPNDLYCLTFEILEEKTEDYLPMLTTIKNSFVES